MASDDRGCYDALTYMDQKERQRMDGKDRRRVEGNKGQ
ncbi:hypothetical protein FOCG_10069 [Fusarium oxysporum f. sp. radicis-lycopersici 26381]|jgi:hypothetical protein|uniref:Uncharacterized protein n=2 Tax=Fusarium oxysporum TaxID=5507 RepID=W9IGA8_FUSOX|nr:hypothetical protein FOYG_06776 [Fusarium oxysporum NRRL 32931]EWZ51013.1 hypothetical protein FOZG_01276 [Fusarium oxysporum Fo47]EWZ91523.1 hypothetical protein FOWG_07057 [Fusarium oxysporum f. sp. lycopersici MN25]EXL49893.1 hypothetical protein FOCG_10069 [Fusarium oxysporum f. sp. radicis-lycopersici 26381]